MHCCNKSSHVSFYMRMLRLYRGVNIGDEEASLLTLEVPCVVLASAVGAVRIG